MASVLDDLLKLMQDGGLGTQGDNLFATTMPDMPNSLICINQYQGRAPEADLGVEQPVVKVPRIQVLGRGTTPQAARAKVEAVYALFCGVVNETVNGTRYLSIWPIQDPAQLEEDENSRSVWVCNFEVQKQ